MGLCLCCRKRQPFCVDFFHFCFAHILLCRVFLLYAICASLSHLSFCAQVLNLAQNFKSLGKENTRESLNHRTLPGSPSWPSEHQAIAGMEEMWGNHYPSQMSWKTILGHNKSEPKQAIDNFFWKNNLPFNNHI